MGFHSLFYRDLGYAETSDFDTLPVKLNLHQIRVLQSFFDHRRSDFEFNLVSCRVHYVRNIIWDQLWCLLRPSYQIPEIAELTVFPDRTLGPFPTKSRLHLRPHAEGWELPQKRLLLGHKTIVLPRDSHQLEIYDELLVNRIQIEGPPNANLLFSKRYSRILEILTHLLGIHLPKSIQKTTQSNLLLEPGGRLNLP